MTRARPRARGTAPRRRLFLAAAGLLLLAGAAPRALAQGAPAPDAKAEPLLQNVTDGYVDWGRGIVGAWGRTIDRTGQPPGEPRPALSRAAEILARRRLVEIVQTLRATSEIRVGDRPDFVERVRGIVRGARIIKEHSGRGRTYDVLLEAPLWGVEGIAFEIYGLVSPDRAAAGAAASVPGAGPSAAPAPAPDAPTGVVIDARGTGVQPALLPRFVDESGAVISSPDTVDIQALRDDGMAAYATVPPGVSALRNRVGDRPVWVRASLVPGGVPAPAPVLPPAVDPFAGRRGPRPYRIKAGGAAGALKADVVLSRADADKLEAAGAKNLLKNCRVVVLVESPVGGVEGVRAPLPSPPPAPSGEIAMRRWPARG